MEFAVWATNFLSYLFKSYERFNIPLAVYTGLEELKEDFAEKLAAAEAPETRTKLTITAKNEARKLFEAKLQQDVNEYLTYNHLVTNEDREGMGLPVHKTSRTPAPVATTYPDCEIDTTMIRRLGIHYFNPGHEKFKAKPPGQHGAEIRWAPLKTPPTRIEELVHSSFDTRTPLILEFGEEERGLMVYFCLRWENTRGEKGPWSPIKSAIIP
jgi:hypothetical protein